MRIHLLNQIKFLEELVETNHIKVSEISSSQLNTIEKIEIFFQAQFEKQGKYYMLSKELKNKEYELDIIKRSTHFCAFYENEIIAVLRLTPFPFEFTSIDEQLWKYSVSIPNNYLEFSRLMTNRKQVNSHCVTLMMALACEWAISRHYEGVVAISQSSQRRYFHRLLRLNPIHPEPIILPSRDNNEYWIMSANWENIQLSQVWQSSYSYPSSV